MKRVFLIVLDSFGIGEMPDADRFGAAGSNTLGTCRKSEKLYVPNMASLGLFKIDGVAPEPNMDRAGKGLLTAADGSSIKHAFARLAER